MNVGKGSLGAAGWKSMVWSLAVLGSLLVGSSGLASAALVAQSKPPGVQGGEPKTTGSKTAGFDGRTALKSAAALAKKVVGLRGEPRRSAMQAALAAYRKITENSAVDSATAARAWFEAAELQRRLGDSEGALAGYAKAAKLDQARFTARAGIARAHLLRRATKLEEALKVYKMVAEIQPTSGRAHQARLGVARCLVDSGELAAAEAAFRVLVEKAGTVVRRIDACNRLAQLQIKQGALDAAAATIASADAAVGRAVGRDADRAKKAAAKMSSKRALKRARDKQSGATEDAVDVDGALRKERAKGDQRVPMP